MLNSSALLFFPAAGGMDSKWLFLLLGAGAAIGLGVFAMSKMRINPALSGGKNLALTGIATGGAAALLLLVTYFVYPPDDKPAGGQYAQQNPPASSANNSPAPNAPAPFAPGYGANSAPAPGVGGIGGTGGTGYNTPGPGGPGYPGGPGGPGYNTPGAGGIGGPSGPGGPGYNDGNTPPGYNEGPEDYYPGGEGGRGGMGGAPAPGETAKYRLIYAASQTQDQQLMMAAGMTVGIIDANGQPTAYYQSFVSGAMAWQQSDGGFQQQVNTPEKARAYVMANMQQGRRP